MTSAFTPSDIVINPSTVVPSQDIQTPLTIRVSGVTNVYIPFSATSLCSVELQFPSAYTGWVACYLEKLTNPQNVNNLYALRFSIQKYRYLPGRPSSRSMAFDVTAATCNIFTEESSFSIVQNGCEIESAYIIFTAQEANSTIGLEKLSTNQALEYSTDGNNWTSMTTATTITLTNSGDTTYIRGILSSNNNINNYTQFKMTGKIAASGNCNYLWNYETPDASLKRYCGYRMFYGCTGLSDVNELTLGTSATTLVQSCYSYMFASCSSLTTAPVLPATTLAQSCYNWMFLGCTSLTSAPALPATALANRCYREMFSGCVGLTTAPDLPATTLADGCYNGMFFNCSNLTYIKCLAVNGINQNDSTTNWVNSVASTGTFVKHPNATDWTRGDNGIPTNWTVEDVN